MIFPLSANRIERLDVDPDKRIEGYIWYNNAEQVYKTWINNELNVIMTDKSFRDDISDLLGESLQKREFTVTFSDAYKVVIKHNKNQTHFTYSVYDSVEKCNLPCSIEIINDDEVNLEFIDPVTGHIYMYFES